MTATFSAEEVCRMMDDAASAAKLHIIIGLLAGMSDSDRAEIFSGVGAYCRHCGTVDTTCQCWNDQ